MLFSSVDRASVFSYFSESRDSDLEKHCRAGEKSTSDISPKAQPSHFTSFPCTHGHALHGFVTGWNIDFHLAFFKYWDTIWINVLKMYFRHWLTFSTFVCSEPCLFGALFLNKSVFAWHTWCCLSNCSHNCKSPECKICCVPLLFHKIFNFF